MSVIHLEQARIEREERKLAVALDKIERVLANARLELFEAEAELAALTRV